MTFSGLLSAGLNLSLRHWLWVSVYLFVITVPPVVVDLFYPTESAIYAMLILLSLGGWFVQVLATKAMLVAEGVAPTERAMVVRAFGLSLITGLGVLLGLVLFLLPGLYIAMRWSLAFPHLIGSDGSIGEALSESWARTAPYQLTLILSVILFPLVMFLVPSLVLVLLDPLDGSPRSIVMIVVGETLASVWGVAIWLIPVAAWLKLRHEDTA